jgi:CMP-N-acetylneuraminic acid synthetase
MATAIVPLKLKSRRLPNKNFMMLGDQPLAAYIFDTLRKVPELNKIYCYTSTSAVMAILPKNIELLPRPLLLDGDDIKANELFRYAIENIDDEIIVLCQAPGPFIEAAAISEGIESVKSGQYDCAFAASEISKYCWFDGKPINYDPIDITQTQNLTPVYAETSGLYVFKKQDYLETGTRISGRHKIIPLDEKQSVDIDTPQDFSLARLFLDFNPERVNLKWTVCFKLIVNFLELPEALGS